MLSSGLSHFGRGILIAFGIAGLPGVIDENAKTITLSVPFGTDLATLAPPSR